MVEVAHHDGPHGRELGLAGQSLKAEVSVGLLDEDPRREFVGLQPLGVVEELGRKEVCQARLGEGSVGREAARKPWKRIAELAAATDGAQDSLADLRLDEVAPTRAVECPGEKQGRLVDRGAVLCVQASVPGDDVGASSRPSPSRSDHSAAVTSPAALSSGAAVLVTSAKPEPVLRRRRLRGTSG